MRIYTRKKILLTLEDIPFSFKMFTLLQELAQQSENLRLRATVFHTRQPVEVKLFDLELDWDVIRSLNP